MLHPAWRVALLPALLLTTTVSAAEPLHVRIDVLIMAKGNGKPASANADDAEFLRRAWLDLAGRIPSANEARAFLADTAADKREKLIDKLLKSAGYPRRMQELFHVMLMERLGDHPAWSAYLRSSFETNRPWDQMARDILSGRPKDESTRGAVFFYAKRLENYGQNPVDYPGLTRDIGRLFLGVDLKCAQCHDHLYIKDYKQQDFQGLFAFVKNVSLQDAKKPSIAEKPTVQKVDFMSVFVKQPRQTGPRLPFGTEMEIPTVEKGKEYQSPPNPKTGTPGVPRFSTLARLAETLPAADNALFSRNIVNRLWGMMMGRGLVHPLDQHHSGNPPSHPELLDLLAKEFVAHKYDIKWLLRELALSQTYQRSSVLPAGVKSLPRESFLTANEKRLSAEQLLASMREAAGERAPEGKADPIGAKFYKAFANPPREPEDEIGPSLKAALFVLNDEALLTWLAPKSGNLVDRLMKLSDAEKVSEELYLSVLTRRPTADEKQMVAKYLEKNKERRAVACGHLVWALLASTEFCVNH